MKSKTKFLAFVGCVAVNFLMVSPLAAQSYVYGVTEQSENGTLGGNIYRFTPQDKISEIVATMPVENKGSHPVSSMIKHSNGFYYGTTGDYAGLIYRFDLESNQYTVIHEFDANDNVNGWRAAGGVIEGSDGKLYGMATYGGYSEYGLIYSYDLAQNSYSVLYEFGTGPNDEGSYPKGRLLEFSPGVFYGMTESGGVYDQGQLFKYDLVNDAYTSVAEFFSYNGYLPTGTPQKMGGDKIIGVTKLGGAYGNGVLFEYNITTANYGVLVDFSSTTSGRFPNEPLVASDGNIYGTTSEGGNSSGGVFYKYDVGVGQLDVLHNFDSDDNLGNRAFGHLVESPSGRIYGTTERANNGLYQYHGNIFEYDLTNETLSNRHSFDAKNGKGPKNGLTVISSGVFLGTTYEGGASGLGTIFKYDANQHDFTKLIDFSHAPFGSSPKGGLTATASPNGLFYGVCYSGGPDENSGTIYSFDPTSNELALVHDFVYEEGGYPTSGLILTTDSILYGVTSEGGNLSGNLALGTLYSFDLKSGVYTQLYNLPLSNGEKSELILLNNKLYGTVNDGGQYNKGMIYEYDLTSGVFSIIYEFDAEGYLPVGHPIVASDGKLYGMTKAGGSGNYGVIYSFSINSSAYTVEHEFVAGLAGGSPAGTLVEGANGIFYGTTENGGDQTGGILFRFTLASGNISVLREFSDGFDAYFPFGELTLSSEGILYGQTSQQQQNISDAIGGIFTYDLNNSTYARLTDFPGDIPNDALNTYCLYPVYDVVGSKQVNLCPGEDLAISVSTDNTDTFVWKKDGVEVPAATANIFFKSAATVSDAGTYTFELTNACGTISGEVKVFVSDISATFTKTDILCFGEATGVIAIVPSGGVAGYEFSLDGINFQTTDFTELAAGTYDITIRDANNCSIEIQQTLSQPAAALSASFTSSAVDCNGNNTGSIEVDANGGVGPYEYSLDGANFVSFASFGALPAGAYPVTVRDANGCSVTETVDVIEPVALSVALVEQPISCVGLVDGSLSATGQGGTAPYEYSIDGTNFQSDVLFGQLTAGDYTITIKDANGCIASADASIIEPEVFTVSASVANASCHGTASGSISIAVTGPDATAYTYSIDGEAFQDTPTFGSLVSGSYTISVKSAAGCVVETDATVSQPDQLLASTTVVNTTCGENNGSVSISAAGGSGTYSYSLEGSDFVADTSFAGLAAGNHTVQVKDEAGCVTDVAFTVAASTGIALTLTEAEGLVTATAEGGTAPYQFSINGAEFQEGNVFNLAPGDYSISAQDANGCGAGQEITIEVETGIGDQFLQNEMLAYPNPSSQSISFNATTIKTVRLFDLSGNKVMTVNNYRTRESIDLSHLVPGVVIVELELSTGKRIKQRLIIER
ncbi:choice-of-anchor tandem repeat GloVer-containing protein [uncultured Imperialibacter sp.]|uniref:choice-of-anchor tandem repeat GloVer-containing protein n=1 Tax=uncultured Imperialibacter sp. TaxID=1672639 RepID=UPI0030DBA0E3|tara:strand:- start:73130 stop:77257 length:4128 start_codon:yes stop_codon:yes gene_type:complete